MSNNLNKFANRMDQTAENVRTNADKLVRIVAIVADQAVVSGTPVDTGRAKSNWIASLNGPPEEIIGAYSPGVGGETAGANQSAALEQAQGVIAKYNGDTDKSIYISNNLEYIEPLNEGHSPQAEAGYVQTAIAEAVSAVQGGIIRLTSKGTVTTYGSDP